jgi:5,10-methylene-tetrahydrofolate dehydrogenase/methenyl tetrahydrofolate cyclohydrolase
MATELRSDILVGQLHEPTMNDARIVHEKTKLAVGFHSIAAYQENNVPGSIDAYRRGVRKAIAASSGHIVLDNLNVGQDGVRSAIHQHDARYGGLPGGMMFMIPHPKRAAEAELCELIPPQMDIDGASGNGHYRAPTATAMRVMAEYAVGSSLRDTKGRLSMAVIGAGRTTGEKLIGDLHRMDLDPLVITQDNPQDRRFLSEFGLIFTAVGRETITPLDVRSGAILIDAGVRVEDPANPRKTTFGDINPDVYDMDGVTYTPLTHGIGQLTTAIAVSNATEAASRYNLLSITPRPLSPVPESAIAA